MTARLTTQSHGPLLADRERSPLHSRGHRFNPCTTHQNYRHRLLNWLRDALGIWSVSLEYRRQQKDQRTETRNKTPGSRGFFFSGYSTSTENSSTTQLN